MSSMRTRPPRSRSAGSFPTPRWYIRCTTPTIPSYRRTTSNSPRWRSSRSRAISAGGRRGANRRTVIHHGLDPSRFRWTHQPGPYVCFVGRFAQEKGVHTAIDVAQAAGVPIRVAGEVHPRDCEFGRLEVESRLRRSHVTYLGCIGSLQKMPLLRDARALLAPIEWNEPFGLILIEAMLSGLSGRGVRPRQRARAGRARRHGPDRRIVRGHGSVHPARRGGGPARPPGDPGGGGRAVQPPADGGRVRASLRRGRHCGATRAGRWPITAA